MTSFTHFKKIVTKYLVATGTVVATVTTVIAFITIFFLFSPQHAAASTITLPSNNLGLVGHWTLDDATGTVAHDSSGNNNNGTLQNSPAWVNGKHGKALSFNGTNQYVTASDMTSINGLSQLTISGWVEKNAATAGGTLFEKRANTGAWITVEFAPDGNLYFIPSSSGGYGYAAYPTDTAWHYYTTVFDGTQTGNSNRLKIFIDGVQQTLTFSGTIPATTGSFTATENIGLDTQNTRYINGSIDDVRVYNRTLTQAQITTLYGTGELQRVVKNNTGLVGAWSFDEATGTVAHDISGNRNTGTLQNSPVWVSGRHGGALSFNGTNQYVSIPNQDRTVFSVSMWLKRSRLGAQWGSFGCNPFCDRLIGGSLGAWGIAFNSNNTLFLTNIGNSSVNSTGVIADTTTWHHVVVTYDGSTAKFYIDGVLAGSPGYATAFSSSGNYAIGTLTNSLNQYFGGSLDDVRIYKTALTQAQITALYTSGEAQQDASQNSKMTNGLVGLWSFDGRDINGTTAFDRSGSGNNGTLTNGPSPVAGKIGQALSFNGTNYVSIGTPAVLDFGSNDFTVSMWLKLNSIPSGQQGIIGKGSDPTSGRHGWFLSAFPFGGHNYIQFQKYNSSGSQGAANYQDPTLGVWHHVVFGQAGSQQVIYIDGTLTDSESFSINADSSGYVAYIAAVANEAVGFNGSIDDVRIYNRALSASEVSQLYNIGK